MNLKYKIESIYQFFNCYLWMIKNSDTLIELSNVKNTCEQCSVDDEGNTDFCDTHRKHFNEFVEDMPDMDKVL